VWLATPTSVPENPVPLKLIVKWRLV
jgi:hypothetical protein